MELQQFIRSIRGTEPERKAVIQSIYNDTVLKDSIYQFVINNKGSKEDAELVFDDMIVQFIKTAFGNPNLSIAVKLQAYLMGIAKHLWYAQLKSKSKFIASENIEQLSNHSDGDQPESIFLNSERLQILSQLLLKLRNNCHDVLMHWAHGFNMEEIAAKLNYLSEGMARKKKSQCLKELLVYIQSNPHIKSALIG